MSYYAQDHRDTRPAPGKLQCQGCKHWYYDFDFDGDLCDGCAEEAETLPVPATTKDGDKLPTKEQPAGTGNQPKENGASLR